MGDGGKKKKKTNKVLRQLKRKGVKRKLLQSSDSESDYRFNVHNHVNSDDSDGSVSCPSRPPTPLPPERRSRSPTRSPRSRRSRSRTPPLPTTPCSPPPHRRSPSRLSSRSPTPPARSPSSSKFSGTATLSPSVLPPQNEAEDETHEDDGAEDVDPDGDHDNEVQGDDDDEPLNEEVEHDRVSELIQSDQDDEDDDSELTDKTAVECRLTEEIQNRTAQYVVSPLIFFSILHTYKFSLIS